MGFRMLPPAALLAATLLLAGCVPSEPTITPAPEPSVTPIFASDKEALAAATDAYAKYLEVSDEIAIDGGANPDRIAALVSKARLQVELQAYGELAVSGSRQEGESSFDSAKLQQVIEEGADGALVVFYVCLDQTAAKFLDSNGKDITPRDTELRSGFEVTFRAHSVNEQSMTLEGMERWSGARIC